MPTESLTTALARLESRWGSAAVRLASDMRLGAGLGAVPSQHASDGRTPTASGADRFARSSSQRPTAEENASQVDGALALAIRAQPAPELTPT
ncbi:MAG: hypothetical protein WD830_03685, partial [Chloroflexota bacterium]